MVVGLCFHVKCIRLCNHFIQIFLLSMLAVKNDLNITIIVLFGGHPQLMSKRKLYYLYDLSHHYKMIRMSVKSFAPMLTTPVLIQVIIGLI